MATNDNSNYESIMNREIKFRGKRTDEGGWIYGNLCSYLFDCAEELTPCIHIGKKGYIRNGFYQVDPSTVGQYTGLNDCNGKEIYEKDIVRISIRPTAEEAKANKRNTKLMGIQMPSWMNGGDVIARVSYFDCAFHFIHLKSFLPDSNRLIQEPMLHYLYDERHPDTPHIFDQTIEVIGNIFDNPELLKQNKTDDNK